MWNYAKPIRYMGIGGAMIPIPKIIAEAGLKKGVTTAKTKADLLTMDERRVHLFVVRRMAVSKAPLTAKNIAEELCIPVHRIEKIINRLEVMKTFIYRTDGKGINWAYPLTLENTGHQMTASTGEIFFAA